MTAIAHYTSRQTHTLPQQVNQVPKQDDSPRDNETSFNDQQPSNRTKYLLCDQYGIKLQHFEEYTTSNDNICNTCCQKCIFYRSCQELKNDDENNAQRQNQSTYSIEEKMVFQQSHHMTSHDLYSSNYYLSFGEFFLSRSTQTR